MTTIVDYREAIEKAGGNTELAKELFGMLLEELPKLREKLQNAIAQDDLQAIWNHAHKIYGSTAYCGVPVLRQAASTMEMTVRSKELDAIRQEFESLNVAINQLLTQGPAHLTQDWK
jgi:two-component system sensor histidine kinase BarA